MDVAYEPSVGQPDPVEFRNKQLPIRNAQYSNVDKKMLWQDLHSVLARNVQKMQYATSL